MEARIRPATLDDAPDMAAVHLRSWRWAYRGLVPEAYLASLVLEERLARWRAVIGDGLRNVAVVEVDGRIAGFISVAATRDGDAPPGTGELMALYLDPDAQRRGLGRKLVEWGREVVRARGFTRWTLWVLRDNERARGFYEAVGFRADGAAKDHDFGGEQVPEVRYAEALVP